VEERIDALTKINTMTYYNYMITEPLHPQVANSWYIME